MPFIKGVSGNVKGRKIGKTKKPIKPMIEKLLEHTFPVIEQDMKHDPSARISFFMDLTKIVLQTKI